MVGGATRADSRSSGKHIAAAQKGLVYENESEVVDKETQLGEKKEVKGNNL